MYEYIVCPIIILLIVDTRDMSLYIVLVEDTVNISPTIQFSRVRITSCVFRSNCFMLLLQLSEYCVLGSRHYVVLSPQHKST